MPQIIVKGMKEEELREISTELLDKVSSSIEVSKELINLVYLPVKFFKDGEEIDDFPIVEVIWRDKGQEYKDRFAAAIYEEIKKKGYEKVAINFFPLTNISHYKNGKAVS